MRRPKVRPGRTKVVGYVRVSTSGQAEDGVSLAEQRETIEYYAHRHELDLVRVEQDEGVSAGTLERPGLRRALAALRRGEAKAIVVTTLSRLTRSMRDLGALVDDYFDAGRGSLISLKEEVDTRSAHGRLVLNVMGAIAAWEREAGAERTAAAMRHLAENGRFGGGTEAPYGYRLARDGRTLAPVKAEQVVVRKAVRLRAAGLSYRKIAARLAELGHRSRTRKVFGPKQIMTMLRRAEIVAGAARRKAA